MIKLGKSFLTDQKKDLQNKKTIKKKMPHVNKKPLTRNGN